jgi:acyl carrier protein
MCDITKERVRSAMTDTELREQITSIIRSVLDRQELNFDLSDNTLQDDTNLAIDLGMDSIEIITVIAEIESAFDVEFDYTDMDIENITRVGNIVQSLAHALSVSRDQPG